jgi:hypothetical protein
MGFPSNLPEGVESLIVKPDLSELEGIETPVVATLENVMVFANRLQEVEREVDALDQYKKTLTEEIKDIEETKLPQILEILGMPWFGLKDGSKVEIKPTFQGSLVSEDLVQRQLQLDWLVANDGQDLIKNAYTITFGKGQDAEAKALRDMLVEFGFDFEVKESVHAGSLGSFIKEKMTNGDEVPLSALKWRFFQKANIKAPPKAKVKKVK